MTGAEPLDLSLAGRLLVATPGLLDPNFAQAVVLVLDHDDDGAIGVVLNRPLDVAVVEVLPAWSDAAPPAVLFSGGPVEQEGALAVGVAKPARDGAPDGFRPVHGRLGLLDLDADPGSALAALDGLRVFAGYAGWDGGQLEGELAEGSWYVVESRPEDLLSDTPLGLWRSVLRRQPGDLALVSTWTEDPELN